VGKVCSTTNTGCVFLGTKNLVPESACVRIAGTFPRIASLLAIAIKTSIVAATSHNTVSVFGTSFHGIANVLRHRVSIEKLFHVAGADNAVRPGHGQFDHHSEILTWSTFQRASDP
jgi:hypothetical protein